MAFIKWLMGGSGQDEGGTQPPLPWDCSPSIYAHIKAHALPGQPRLSEAGEGLPDEERIAARSKFQFRFVAGGEDGIFNHHFGQTDEEGHATELLRLVGTYCEAPTVANKLAVYEFITATRTISLIDPFMQKLLHPPQPNAQRAYDLARSLATEATDREPVKFGIALLGLFRRDTDKELFLTLGRHDEFALFSAVALAQYKDPEPLLWQLARNVSGWGRVQAVERLARIARSPEVKDWLLRDGFRNDIMNEYLACVCARAGGLRNALSRPDVDDQLLMATGEILDALISGGPAEGIDQYDDGVDVVEAYLGHLRQRAATLGHFLTAVAINQYLTSDQPAQGWTVERRNACVAACSDIINRPVWQELVRVGLVSEDEQVFQQANQAAEALKIDTWVYHWDRLQRSPHDSGRWFNVMRRVDGERIGPAIRLAEQHLPLTQIGAGPASENGLGSAFSQHSCLDFILQDLSQFPGHGGSLVAAGLRSPVVRNRNMALKVLSKWGRSNWPEGMDTTLHHSLEDEPEEEVRARIQKVIDGKPID